MRRALRRVPAPLALLLVVVALFGAGWALIVPAWGNADEDAHFAYSQTLAELGDLPGHGDRGVSTEQRLSMTLTNTDETTVVASAKPEWSRAFERRFDREQGAAARDDGGSGRSSTANYPPAYYLYETVPYRLAAGADIFTRLYAMRLFSLLWLLVTTAAAWLLAGEVFGRRRQLQLVTAAAVGLWPTVAWISSSVNPDGMLIAFWSLSTWLAVSLVKGNRSAVRAAALCACVGLALVTKATAFALVPPAAFALGVAAWEARGRVDLRRLAATAAVIAPLALLVGGWALVAHANGRSPYAQAALVSSAANSSAAGGASGEPTTRAPSANEFASYLWQYYLPQLPFQHEINFTFPAISRYPAYQTWLAGGWANFGWANVWFPSWVYLIFLGATALALGALALTAVRRLRAPGPWRPGRRTLRVAILLAVTAGALLAGLHWTEFNMWLEQHPPFLQGRYILPLAPLFALALAQATRAFARRWQPAAQAAVLGSLVVLQLACLGLEASRYYG
jgi:4-amino-4-deoxy-L-arabinose transferase-like glycosyltransferase